MGIKRRENSHGKIVNRKKHYSRSQFETNKLLEHSNIHQSTTGERPVVREYCQPKDRSREHKQRVGESEILSLKDKRRTKRKSRLRWTNPGQRTCRCQHLMGNRKSSSCGGYNSRPTPELKGSSNPFRKCPRFTCQLQKREQ